MLKLIKIVYLSVCVAVLASSNAFSDSSYEKLIRAVEDGEIDTVRMLLKRGMDPNTTDPRGISILMIAARKGDDSSGRKRSMSHAEVNRRDRADG